MKKQSVSKNTKKMIDIYRGYEDLIKRIEKMQKEYEEYEKTKKGW